MAKSRITNLVFKREFESKNGTAYIYTMELEDGTKGDFFAKENPIKKAIGEEIEYDYEPNANPQYLGKIKEKQEKKTFGSGGGFKKNESAENARTALIVAKDIFIAGKGGEMKTIQLAEVFFDFLEKHSTPK
jgi:hypothetical protein